MSEASTVIEVIERTASRAPASPALWAHGETVNYAEFLARARRLAAALLDSGVEPRDRVAILSRRSATAYVSIVAALRAACAYVPLNLRFPCERNAAILAASGASAVIADEEGARFLPELLEVAPGVRVVATLENAVTRPLAVRARLSGSDVDHACPPSCWPEGRPDDICYLLFTSGSTGQPKGVPITNANVLAYLHGISELGSIDTSDRLIQLVDLTFDLSAHDMFLAWTSGAALYSVPENSSLLGPRFVQEHALTAWMSVPSTASLARQFRMLEAGSMPSLRLTYFCGEALAASIAEAWASAAPHSVIINSYGPTEATIAFSTYRYQPGRSDPPAVVPIGYPLKGQRMGIFGTDGAPVAAGDLGELHLAGTQLTPGYWQAPHLDAGKFIVLDGVRWYRTGDLARLCDDGYHFAGRVDRQVKIRGFRVELQEIEGALRRVTGRDLLAVLAWPVTDDGVAHGTVAFFSGEVIVFEPVRTELARMLPAYMIPERAIFVDHLPLNANGKIDYRALREHSALSALGRR